jgi:hypothetical protein
MAEEELPPIQYYEILSYATIVRTRAWWNLVALLRDPSKDKVFTSIYKFQRKKGEWHRATNFKINNPKHVPPLVQGLEELWDQWQELLEGAGE